MAESISDAQGRGMGTPEFDPRDIITPDAFEVDESLLGTPLAAPWQRLVAFLVDLAIAGFIANVAGGLVSIVVVYVFYRLATRTEIKKRWKRYARGCLVFIGGVILFVLTIALVEDVQEWGPSSPGLQALLPGVRPDTAEIENGPDERRDAAPLPSDSASIAGSEPPAEAVQRNAQLWETLDTAEARTRARLLHRYARALAATDSAALDSLTPPVEAVVAGRTIDALEAQVEELEDTKAQVEDENDELRRQVQSPSLFRMMRATANDFGITIGWVGLYFTLFLAWWTGRTPGKYLVGIRVVRLSGEPLSLWLAFERFGGYAAGIATGMFGFAQLYWDPNRQALHDRIARTVVIRTRS